MLNDLQSWKDHTLKGLSIEASKVNELQTLMEDVPEEDFEKSNLLQKAESLMTEIGSLQAGITSLPIC